VSWDRKQHSFADGVEVGDDVVETAGRYSGKLTLKDRDYAMVEKESPGVKTTYLLPCWMELKFRKATP
jgi:hypothetical protein